MVQMSQSGDVRWFEQRVDGGQSIAVFFQLYSDKSKTKIKFSGLTFYPIHINVMNVSKPMPHLMTSHGHAFLYFLPVQFLYVYDDMYGED